jgi:N-acetylated-alpha-linked acidic dipeptidase
MTRAITANFFPFLFLALHLGSLHAVITEDEQIFLSVPDSKSARENLHFITSQPHVAGTSGDVIMAKFVLEEFQNAGIPDGARFSCTVYKMLIDKIKDFEERKILSQLLIVYFFALFFFAVDMFNLDVLLNYPQTPATLQLVSAQDTSQVIYNAKLSEDVLDFDPTSDTIWRNHTFHGYGASGKISAAAMVYANYGRVQDFNALETAGVDINNTLVVVRYGKCFRGLKVKNAQERGAVGVLMYSDPADDGYVVGPVYPEGPWRPACGVQRGSVQFLSVCAGDPIRADERYGNETLKDICGVEDYTDLIPKIPSLPISYGDAFPFLEKMGGKRARDVGGDDFCGGLDLEYTVGPSSDTALANLVVDNREEIRSIPNVIGRIPGLLPPDQDMPVLLGNHRDAW